uniref:Uncharacterized protein n=1 Tax=Tanacetum cinerariifolium TaxID=118510 RepID=A0A6L2J4V8_TANCI|nr:hypothetical protein [Tanacetum cinerariifolium]
MYGAFLPDILTNQELLDSKAYKEYYAVASGAKPLKAKIKCKKKEDEPVTPSKSKSAPVAKGTRLKTPAKMANKRSKKDFYMSHASGSSDGVNIQSKVPNKQQQKTSTENDEDDVEESDVNDDSEETKSDNDGDDLTYPNLSTYKAYDEEEEKDKVDDDELSSDQRVYSPPDHELTEEEENKKGNDEDMEDEQEQDKEDDLYRDKNINVERSDAEMSNTQENQDTEDTHVTLTTVPLVVQQQSSSVSSDLLQTNKLKKEAQAKNQEFLNQVDLTMTTINKEQVQAQVSKIMLKNEKYVTESLGAKVLVRTTNQPQASYTVATSLSEFELKKILIDKIEENQSVNRLDIQKNIYNALVKSYNSDKDIFSSYGDVVTLKRGRDDQEKDKDPFTGSNRGSKKRRSGKEVDSSKEPTHKEFKSTSSSKGASRSQPKSSGKSAYVDEHGQKVDDLEEQSHQEFNTRNDDESSVREALDVNESQWNPSSSPTPDHKVSRIWSLVKVIYYWGTCHRGPKRQKFYGYASNMETSKDVYSRHMIISVTSLKIMKYFGYSHLEEIIVRRQDDQLYKFREGDFKRLRRQDIQDLLLLSVQSKMSNLNLEERYALNVALRMFTRCIVIQECMEDLQLGVKSYQKKINLTRPDTYHSDLKRMTPYTAYLDIQGIIYEDEMNRNRLMRTNELHKFSEGTLNYVCTALNDIITGIEMDYLPKRKWSKHDKKRARVMINVIDRKLRDRRLM